MARFDCLCGDLAGGVCDAFLDFGEFGWDLVKKNERSN